MNKGRLNLRLFSPCAECSSLWESLQNRGIIYDINNKLVLYKQKEDVYIYAHLGNVPHIIFENFIEKISLLGLDTPDIINLQSLTTEYVMYNRSEVSFYVSEVDYHNTKNERARVWR